MILKNTISSFCFQRRLRSPGSKKKEYDYNPNTQQTKIRRKSKYSLDKDQKEKRTQVLNNKILPNAQ